MSGRDEQLTVAPSSGHLKHGMLERGDNVMCHVPMRAVESLPVCVTLDLRARKVHKDIFRAQPPPNRTYSTYK